MHDTKEQEANVVLGSLSIAQIYEMLNAQLNLDAKAAEAQDSEKGSRRLIKAMAMTASVWQLPISARRQCQILAKDYCRTMPAESLVASAREKK